MSFDYIKEYYKVPAEIGGRVRVYGKTGTIVEDRDHHIGVMFDNRPGVVHSAHPTDGVEYLEESKVRITTCTGSI